MFTIQKELAGLYPGAFTGILIMRDVLNIAAHEKLDLVKRGIENSIREKYGKMSRNQLKSLHPMDIYIAYYKKFGYSYHVLHQVESIIRGKTIPGGKRKRGSGLKYSLINYLIIQVNDVVSKALYNVVRDNKSRKKCCLKEDMRSNSIIQA